MAEILIYDVIGEGFFFEGITAKSVKAQIDGMSDDEEVLVRINSPGGDAFEGLAIHNVLAERGVNVQIDGLAASAASIIAAAGDDVTIAKNGLIMIHNPWSVAVGEAKDMVKRAEMLGKVKDSAVISYQRRVDLSDGDLAAMMDDETWMNAKDAVELGFADSAGAEADLEEDDVRNALGSPWIHHAPRVAMAGNCVKFRLSHRYKRTQGVRNMAKESPEITLELIVQNHPEIADALRKQGAESVDSTAAATAERERIQGVLDQSLPGHEKLIRDLAFDGKTTPEQAAVLVLKAEKEAGAIRLEDRRKDSPEPVEIPPVEDVVEDDDDRPIDQIAADEWENDPKIRAEFGDDEAGKESYVSFRVKNEAGQVKMLRNQADAA